MKEQEAALVEALERALTEAGLPSLESEDVYREVLGRPFSSVRAARRAAIAADAPRVLAVLLAGMTAEQKADLLRALLADNELVEERLWWSADDQENGYDSLSMLADSHEWHVAGVHPVVGGVQLPRQFLAMLPTTFEKDDGWPGGIGWFDCEQELFDTEAEAEAALATRKLSLLAPEVPNA